MVTKLFLILAVIGTAILSLHHTNGHAIGIDSVKHKGIEAITAVKVASDKVTEAAAVPLELLKKKAVHAVKVPIALAKKKLAAGLALKKLKIIAPIVLFKAAKKAIGTQIAKKKLKLAALKAALGKHIALAKLSKLAKISVLLWKLKLPIISLKNAIKAHYKKKLIAWEGLENAAKLAALKKLGGKEALLHKVPSLPVPEIEKGTDLGLSALLTGAVPFLGSAVNVDKQVKIPDVVYQFVPDYASQFKNVQIIPKKPDSVNFEAIGTYEAKSSFAPTISLGHPSASLIPLIPSAKASPIFGLPHL